MSTPLLAIGHSHLTCLVQASEVAQVPLTALNFWQIPGAVERDEGMPPRFADHLSRQLAAHTGPVFSLIGGSAHTVLGLLVHPRRFDFVLAAEPELGLHPQAELLPQGAVREVLAGLMAEYFALMLEVQRLRSGPMFHLEPPPPFADGERMTAGIPWKLYPGMLREISAAPFRYKLWRLHSDMLREWCDNNGATFVSCPPCRDESGFLRDAFFGDSVHASPAYGALVLDQMRRLT